MSVTGYNRCSATVLYVFKAVLVGLVKVEGPVPDAEMMGPVFENGLLCLVLYEKWHITPGEKDVLDKLTNVFTALHPHILQPPSSCSSWSK